MLIALIYGPASLFTSLPFLLAGSMLISLLWLLVSVVARWRAKTERAYHEEAARHVAAIEKIREEAVAQDSTRR